MAVGQHQQRVDQILREFLSIEMSGQGRGEEYQQEEFECGEIAAGGLFRHGEFLFEKLGNKGFLPALYAVLYSI